MRDEREGGPVRETGESCRDRRSVFIGGLSHVSEADWEKKDQMTRAIGSGLKRVTGTTIRKVNIFFNKHTGLVEFTGKSQEVLEEVIAKLLRDRPDVCDHTSTRINIQKIRPFEKGSGKRGREESEDRGERKYRGRDEGGRGSDSRDRRESREEESRGRHREESRESRRERDRAETRGGKTREKKKGGTTGVVAVERMRKELERMTGVTVRLQTGETEEDGETLRVKGRTKSGKRRGWMK